MGQSVASFLAPWSNFYIMTGSSAAALTGLMFVVITLVAGTGRLRRSTSDGLSTFSTPTVLHFCAALFVSAILSAPWRALAHPAVLLGLAGLYGTAYMVHVTLRTMRLATYRADIEDWFWFSALPLTAYLSIVGGAVTLAVLPVSAMFALAAGVLLLMFLGIRNAWDVVTFIAINPDSLPDPNRPDPPP
jgi:hypothetical protein